MPNEERELTALDVQVEARGMRSCWMKALGGVTPLVLAASALFSASVSAADAGGPPAAGDPHELAKQRAWEDKVLHTSKVIDAAKGIYQIPIEAAMKAEITLAAERKERAMNGLDEEPEEDEEAAAAQEEELPLPEVGKKAYEAHACMGCHSLDGVAAVAPSFKGLFGKTETLADGSTVQVDEAYLRESILEPQVKVVKGFAPIMPPFKGVVTDRQLDGLIAFIKEQK